MEVLREGIRLAEEAGFETSVITNAYWAASVSKAKSVLTNLQGLTRLGVSTDSFHQAFIPIPKVINAIRAAHELGIYCAVRVSYLDDPDAELAAVQRQLASVAGLYFLEHQPVVAQGRAETEVDRARIYSYSVSGLSCRAADVIAVNDSGSVTACCGATANWSGAHALRLGDVRNERLHRILLRADREPAVHVVRLWGPDGLLRLAQREAEHNNKDLPLPEARDICALCKIMNTEEPYKSLLRSAMNRTEEQRRIAVARLSEFGEHQMLMD
jgi:hypothetical protein